MPLSISGTNCRGSLTNFFMALTSKDLDSGFALSVAPRVGERLEHDGDRDGTRVQGADAALAGVGGPAAHGLHRPRRLRVLAGIDRRRPPRRGSVLPGANL